MLRIFYGVLLYLITTSWLRAEIILKIHSAVQVEGSNVTIGDVADVECQCNADAVKEISLGNTPRIGYERIITQAEIRYRLNKAGYVAKTLYEDKVRVTRRHKHVGAEMLIKEARNGLEAWLHKQGFDVLEIETLSQPHAVDIPTGPVHIGYEISKPLLGNKIRVWLEIRIRNKHYQTYPLWFQVKALKKAYVVEKPIQKGVELTKHVKLASVPIKDIGGNYLDTGIDLMRSRYQLTPGHIIKYEDVEQIPVVQKGAVIGVTSIVGKVAISTKGLAMEDGGVGDIVRLRSVGSGLEFKAKVMSEGSVIALGAQ